MHRSLSTVPRCISPHGVMRWVYNGTRQRQLSLCNPPSVRYVSSCLALQAVANESTGSSTAASSTGPQDVLKVLKSRNLVQDVTSDDLGSVSASEPLTVYVGFDPTADALHLGNLLGIIVLSWFQRCGHQGVALIGGATGRVGDPSGKTSERPMLSVAEIDRNVAGIGKIITDILERGNKESSTPIKIVNNYEWYKEMGFLTFLREVGKHARMGTMLNKDSVKSRLASDAGMSFTEFTYQLLQGYDFVHLCRSEGVRVQAGGSDQWGNITAGTDLVKKLIGDDAPTCFGVTFPLLVDSEGQKIGKSEGGGAAWLAAAKLSPYKFYQYLFKTADADVIKFMKMMTFLDLDTIQGVEESMKLETYIPNSAQTLLAEEVTRFVHGEAGLQVSFLHTKKFPVSPGTTTVLQAAKRTTAALKPGSDTPLDAQVLADIAEDAPTTDITQEEVLQPISSVMVTVGLQPSKAAAKRMIKNGGVYKNNRKVTDAEAAVAEDDLIDGNLLLLAAGKKNKMIVRVQ